MPVKTPEPLNQQIRPMPVGWVSGTIAHGHQVIITADRPPGTAAVWVRNLKTKQEMFMPFSGPSALDNAQDRAALILKAIQP
jgi:hypothetical protein